MCVFILIVHSIIGNDRGRGSLTNVNGQQLIVLA